MRLYVWAGWVYVIPLSSLVISWSFTILKPLPILVTFGLSQFPPRAEAAIWLQPQTKSVWWLYNTPHSANSLNTCFNYLARCVLPTLTRHLYIMWSLSLLLRSNLILYMLSDCNVKAYIFNLHKLVNFRIDLIIPYPAGIRCRIRDGCILQPWGITLDCINHLLMIILW